VDLQSIISLPLVSVADAMEFSEAGAGKSVLVAGLVMTATRQIEQECGRFFAPQAAPFVELLCARQTLRREYDWGGYGEVTMGGSGLVIVAKDQSHALMGVNIDPASVEVRYDPMRLFTDDNTLFDPTEGDYFMDGDTLVIQRGTHYGPRTLKITYNSGFTVIAENGSEPAHLSNVPAELRQACLFQTAFLKVRSKTDNIGMTGERSKSTRGVNSVLSEFSVLGGLCPEAETLVTKYKQVQIGNS
jgi:hypothetical protein